LQLWTIFIDFYYHMESIELNPPWMLEIFAGCCDVWSLVVLPTVLEFRCCRNSGNWCGTGLVVWFMDDCSQLH
jgi:hypothetical protein